MKLTPGRNGGTLKSWTKGESGNPKGRMKGLTYWLKELQGKKKFTIRLETVEHDGSVKVIENTVSLNEGAAKMAATQLLIKAARGNMEAIREILKMEQASCGAGKMGEEPPTPPQSTPFTIINPEDSTELDLSNIGAADEETT